jgi:2,3-bisphosphoglycerate-independent phosphoglycerate mutase
MKTILIILDGMSEDEREELNNMTPLEYAYTPILDTLLNIGNHDKTFFYPFNRDPDSLVCILSILGVGESLIPKNRAYLEALASGISVADDEVVLRCNLVSIKNNKLESFNAKGLSNFKMRDVSENISTDGDVNFYHVSDYRNLLVMKKNEEILNLTDIPPHENVGKDIAYMLKDISNIDTLKLFIEKYRFEFNGIEYMFYPWGVSEKTTLPTFLEIHNKSCSCVCCTEIVRGIAKAMKIDLVNLKNVTGDTDTDLSEKANAVLDEINTHDVVIAHINGTDEVSHRKDLYGKVKFIEKIDKEFLSKIYTNISKTTKIIIVSDHQTSSKTGKHEKGYVDIIRNMI